MPQDELALFWHVQKVMSIGGLLAALAGVVTFGWHFVGINALAAQSDSGDIPADSWRGKGARSGLLIGALGVALAVASIILSANLPSRY